MAKLPTHTYATYANVTVPAGGFTVSGSNVIAYTAYTTKQPKVMITDSDIELDGLSLKATLQAVNERLAVLIPNPALEREFNELQACGDEYRRLERELQEQIRIWNVLKSTD